MYTYPNGLRCRASKLRVTLYEWIVPPLACVAMFAGIPILLKLYQDVPNPLHLIALMLWSWLAWVIACSALGCGLFVLWCKPEWGAKPRNLATDRHKSDCTAG